MAARGPNQSYTVEFVEHAVRTAIEARDADGQACRSLRSVGVELGVPWASLYRWIRRAHPEKFGPHSRNRPVAVGGPMLSASGIHRDRKDGIAANMLDTVRCDNQRLAQENAILKAALSLIARDRALPLLRN